MVAQGMDYLQRLILRPSITRLNLRNRWYDEAQMVKRLILGAADGSTMECQVVAS